MKTIIYTSILASAMLFSCSKNSNEDLVAPQTKTLPANVKLIFDTNCVSCHGAVPSGGAPTSYTNYTQVKNDIDKIITYVENGIMPVAGPLSAEDIATIKKWKTDGYPSGN